MWTNATIMVRFSALADNSLKTFTFPTVLLDRTSYANSAERLLWWAGKTTINRRVLFLAKEVHGEEYPDRDWDLPELVRGRVEGSQVQVLVDARVLGLRATAFFSDRYQCSMLPWVMR